MADFVPVEEIIPQRAGRIEVDGVLYGWMPLGSPVDWEKLRAPFPPEQIGKLPKGKAKGENVACATCGGWHATNLIHLDYIGHAWLTERLNEYGGDWTLKPGTPMFAGEDLVWMEGTLIVGGVARHEVGCADPRKEEWPKLLWSDTLTRCAMRHGIGLALWQKDTPVAEDREIRSSRAKQPQAATRASGASSSARSQDPDLEAVLELLQDDVAALPEDDKIAWAGWKAGTPDWWKKLDTAVAARNYVMELLAHSTAEPFIDPEDQSPGTEPY